MQNAVRARPVAANAGSQHLVAAPRPCSIHTQQHGASTRRQQQRLHVQQRVSQHSIRRWQPARAEPSGGSRITTTTGSSNSSSIGNSAPNSSSSMITESDISFLFKLLAFSFAGAALIKYGSLVLELPFHPNAVAALTAVLGTPAAYALYLLTKGDKAQ